MDVLSVVKYASYVGIAVVAIAALWLAKENSGSRNMLLATGALLSALLFFVIQVTFELKGSTTYDQITAEFVMDRSKSPNMVLTYPLKAKEREMQEIEATSWLLKSNPAVLDHDLKKYGRDLSIFSLLNFFGQHEQDWHGQATYGLVGHMSVGTIPEAADCTFVTKEDLKTQLANSGNLFAEGPLFIAAEKICLPPKSTIEISAGGLTIRNPICQIWFSMEAYGFMGFNDFEPRPQVLRSDVQTFLGGWKVETKFFDNRAQNRMVSKYREWASRVVKGTREWFEGTT